MQRVSRGQVRVAGRAVGTIAHGLCVLVGVGQGDTADDADFLARKVVGLRVFSDEEGKMNLSVYDVGGGVLAISQFTLLGDVRKGKRPSFAKAMEPGQARELFDAFCHTIKEQGVKVETGEFGADMEVDILGNGPVTILLDSQRMF